MFVFVGFNASAILLNKYTKFKERLNVILRKRKTPSTAWGHPDFFDNRHKRKMLKLSEIKPSDAFYDLGCGDGSILILAVKEFNVKEAIGIESHPLRYLKAKCNGKKQKLSNRITAAEVNYVINQLKAVGVSIS